MAKDVNHRLLDGVFCFINISARGKIEDNVDLLISPENIYKNIS